MRGRQNASVLPEPVNAIPMRSRPEKLVQSQLESASMNNWTYATGIPWSWMGVGDVIRLDFRYSRIDCGIFMSWISFSTIHDWIGGQRTLKCSMGGGMSSPSAII